MGKPIVVVGAGLSGLICARRLVRSGREVIVIDREDRLGGKMKTDAVMGYRLDRGFQVYFTGYPMANREIGPRGLDFREFAPGALVNWDGALREVRQDDPVSLLFGGYLGPIELWSLKRYDTELAGYEFEELWHGDDLSIADEFERAGFSNRTIERFLRPFFSGVFLDRTLSGSAQLMRSIWKSMNAGKTVMPALGIEEIPRQIGAELPSTAFRFGATVDGVVRAAGTVAGVKLSNGDVIETDQVVLACDPIQTAEIAGLSAPGPNRASTTIYFAAESRPVDEPILILNGNFAGLVNHVAVTSNVSSALAPASRHLVAATVLGNPTSTDGALARSVLYEMGHWFPSKGAREWEPLAVYRISDAQAVQVPGFSKRRRPVSVEPGLWLASEETHSASVDGAVRAGLAAARGVLRAAEPVAV